MEASKIIADARREVDDRTPPYHVEDEDFFEWLSEAEREAAIRGRLLFEYVNPDLCEITIVPGQARYALDPRWFAIEAVALDRTQNNPGSDVVSLQPVNTLQSQLAYRRGPSSAPIPNLPWWFYKNGCRLETFSVDGSTITVGPTPDDTYGASIQPGVLRLAGYRMPLFDIESNDDEPEIPAVHHDGLVQWMLYKFFSQKDEEFKDDKRAALAFNLFEARFGPRPTAVEMRKQAERRRWTTRPARYP